MRWEHWLYTIPLRVRSVFRREQVEQELDDEIRFHVDRQIAEDIARGSTPEQAREAARRAMIGIEQRKEECRDARRVGRFEELRRNVAFALRRIRRTPGLTSAVVLTLTLGIGATTTVFTAVNTLVLRPLPVPAGDRLVFFNHGRAASFSYPDYQDFRDRNDVLSGLTAYRLVPMNFAAEITGNARIWGYEATGNYFDLLGVRPLLGRLLGPSDDDRPGAHPVVVLSYDCWRRRFLADVNVVGQVVKINGLSYTVLGVTPAGFRGTELIVNPDVWVPMSMAGQIEPGEHWLDSRSATNVWILGRLKDVVSRAQAQASLNLIANQLSREHPSTAAGLTVELSPPGLIGKALRGPTTAFAAVLMALAAFVLLLACFNLAGMLIASAADRRHEIAVRLALGASRAQLVRQLLTESFLLAIAGGAGGLLVCTWLAGWFSEWQLPFDLPINTSLVIDAHVVLFAVTNAVVATLAFSLAPALQATKPGLVPALKNDGFLERVRHWQIRDVFVAAQITLSIMLLVASLLTVRSLQHALHLDLGFDPEHAVSVSFDLGLEGYSEGRGRIFQQQVQDRVAGLPGISATGLIDYMPLRVGADLDKVSIAGGPMPPRSERRTAVLYSVSANYFAAAGTHLVAGRPIDTRDRAGSPPVAVVNETFVRRLLGGEQPIGKRLHIGDRGGEGIEIVGVVQDGKYQSLGEDSLAAVYSPITQRYNGWTTLVARTSLPPERTLQLIRSAILDLEPTLTLFNVGTLEDQLAFPLFPVRIAAAVLGVFGVLAIVLSSTGIFALVAYAVSRRTREIGIRMALGAGARQVLGTVLGRAFVLWMIGSFLGSITALIVSQPMSAILYNVSPRDPIAYFSALLLTGAVALLACLYPARRAMRISPAETIRQE